MEEPVLAKMCQETQRDKAGRKREAISEVSRSAVCFFSPLFFFSFFLSFLLSVFFPYPAFFVLCWLGFKVNRAADVCSTLQTLMGSVSLELDLPLKTSTSITGREIWNSVRPYVLQAGLAHTELTARLRF
jgi:hypothetical protein